MFIDRLAQTYDALLTRGVAPTRLEISHADVATIVEELTAFGLDAYGAFEGSRLNGFDVAHTNRPSALCWRRPGNIGRYEVVPWQREELAA